MSTADYDAVVVGAGPNGLAAAAELARSGRSVLVLERADSVGGGTRSAALTRPGFVHDVCSAIHPLAVASPFFNQLPLGEHGLSFVNPEAPLAHPLDDGSAALLEQSVDATADGLESDRRTYERLMGPLTRSAPDLVEGLLSPLRIPRHPLVLAGFARHGIRSAVDLALNRFETERARALFAGLAAHSMLSLHARLTAGAGLILGLLAHAYGWPFVKGGSQGIADALASYLRSLGAEVRTGVEVTAIEEVPKARAVLFDVTPRQLDRIAGERFTPRYRRALRRFKYGLGVFKLDWALDDAIPWKASECNRAATVHVGGNLSEIVASEHAATEGGHSERPFLIVAQQSLFDESRAPDGKHTAWAYCHVPAGSTVDMTARIEAQIERYAPGFKDVVLERHSAGPAEIEAYNPNYVGGDINGGLLSLRQHFGRPVLKLVPYATSDKRIFICSSSTPPGGGVHGLCGYYAARAVLRTALR